MWRLRKLCLRFLATLFSSASAASTASAACSACFALMLYRWKHSAAALSYWRASTGVGPGRSKSHAMKRRTRCGGSTSFGTMWLSVW